MDANSEEIKSIAVHEKVTKSENCWRTEEAVWGPASSCKVPRESRRNGTRAMVGPGRN
jgi:hypothetical protein